MTTPDGDEGDGGALPFDGGLNEDGGSPTVDAGAETNDGGQSWTDFRDGLPQQDCYDFVLRHGLDLSGDRLVMATATGCVYVSDDRGETWRTIAEHLPPIYSARFVA